MSNRAKKFVTKFSLSFGKWHFAPTLKLSIFTLILLSILVYLGTWQLDRAAFKKYFLARAEEKINNTPIDLKTMTNPSLEKDRFTPVCIDGVFLDKFSFLVDNQMLNHQVGYKVLTPVQAPNLDKWVLVDRGWVPMGKSRALLPDIEPIFGLKHVCGLISSISSGIVLLKDTVNPEPKWPIVIQAYKHDLISEQLHHQIYPFVLRLQSTDIGHYPQPPIDLSLSSDKHLAYAVQWFIFAFLLVFYYLSASLRRRK
jgi:surfeit locus 1 family protein